MSVAKIIEISAESPESFEAAIRHGIERAGKTIHNIQTAWIKEQQAIVEGDQIVGYRVDLKITFLLDH
jgi:flavin-binding protein dodecin